MADLVPHYCRAHPVGFTDLSRRSNGAILRAALIAILVSSVGGCDSNTGQENFAEDESPHRPPADRIITLAPHLAELVFAAGAGDRLVGVVEFSDYPPLARALPRIGDAFRLDQEALAALRPDLILGWASGNPVPMLERLSELGYRVVALEPAGLEGIAGHLREIGHLAGQSAMAEPAAAAFIDDLDELREQYADSAEITVLYQISTQPMLTISRRHLIGEAIEICGGVNIFAELDELTPSVSVETVLDRAPEVILASGGDGALPDGLEVWTRWQSIPAVRDGNLYVIDADLIVRPATRMLGGVRQICEQLDAARQKRSETSAL
jgi:iron complex transport system substrate-binding protein